MVTSLINAQYPKTCMPQSLIVSGSEVNFRAEPNTTSKPIGKFIDGELINFISVIQHLDYGNWVNFSDAWFKVKRTTTGEEGFIFGKYVKPPEMAYYNHGDCERIQNGNWYGISQEGNNVIVEKIMPSLKKDDHGHLSIVGSKGEQKILVCSQSELNEGKIEGKFYGTYGENLSIGMKVNLLRIKDNNFSLACIGEVELGRFTEFIRKNEKVYFIIEEIDGSQRRYHKQDLTDCLRQFGEVGYTLIFAGDLNNDGIPEVIFSEGDNRGGIMYYFMSTQDRKLELKSIVESSDKC